MLEAVNAIRRSGFDCGVAGRFSPASALSWSPQLAQAADAHARDMAARGFFDHIGSDGSSPAERVSRTGYLWQLVGENLAYATPGHFDAVRVVDAWLTSPTHCANLLNPDFSELGAAVVRAELEYWVQVLAKPR